jgi:hypothetical protein
MSMSAAMFSRFVNSMRANCSGVRPSGFFSSLMADLLAVRDEHRR